MISNSIIRLSDYQINPDNQQLDTATGVLENGDNQTEAGDDQLPSRRAYQGNDHLNQDGNDFNGRPP